MIARLINALRRARIAHHQRRVAAFGMATLAAQIRRDWPAAATFMQEMHAAQAKRDRLLQARPRGACPPCNHKCNEGRACSARFAR